MGLIARDLRGPITQGGKWKIFVGGTVDSQPRAGRIFNLGAHDRPPFGRSFCVILGPRGKKQLDRAGLYPGKNTPGAEVVKGGEPKTNGLKNPLGKKGGGGGQGPQIKRKRD